MDWNLIVTVVPGPGHEHRLLDALSGFGRFRATAYRYVCMGHVDDLEAFLRRVNDAREAGKAWAAWIARVIPVEKVVSFTPETLAARLEDAVEGMVARMGDGTFCVRLERRGLAGRISSREVERKVADHLHDVAAAQGKRLRADLEDPDFLVAAETLGTQCGVALLPRAMRRSYRFISAH